MTDEQAIGTRGIDGGHDILQTGRKGILGCEAVLDLHDGCWRSNGAPPGQRPIRRLVDRSEREASAMHEHDGARRGTGGQQDACSASTVARAHHRFLDRHVIERNRSSEFIEEQVTDPTGLDPIRPCRSPCRIGELRATATPGVFGRVETTRPSRHFTAPARRPRTK